MIKKQFLQSYGGTLLLIAFAVGIYALLTDVFHILDAMLFPSLRAIAAAFFDSFPRLNECLISSLSLLIPGYALGCISGISLGVLISMNSTVKRAFEPIIFALSPVPPSMLTPYLIAIMSTFYISSVSIIFIGVFWPFLGGTLSGISMVDQKYRDNAQVLELSGCKKLFLVTLPAAAPSIFSGAEMALTFSFILLTVAEMFATDSGLGYFIQYYADFSEYDRVLAGLLYTTIVFVSIMLFFTAIKKKVLFWVLKNA